MCPWFLLFTWLYISHIFYFSCQHTKMCNPIQWHQEAVYTLAGIEQILLFLVLVRLDIVLCDLFLIAAYRRSRKWSDVFIMFCVGIWEDARDFENAIRIFRHSLASFLPRELCLSRYLGETGRDVECGPISKFRKEDLATRNGRKSRNKQNLYDGWQTILNKYFLFQILIKSSKLCLIEDAAYIWVLRWSLF